MAKGKVKLLPLFLFTLLLSFASCSEESDDVEEFPNWQSTNEAYWDSLYTATQQKIAAGDTSWKIIRSWSLEEAQATANTDYIIVHVVTAGTGSGSPLYTDSVRVHYTGKLLPSTSYPTGYQFDSSYGKATSTATAAPAQFLVGGLVKGFATALQNMCIGDEWEVYIPYQLGYGTSGSSSIPGYSTLIFNIILVSYYRAGYDVPDFKAKQANF